MNQTLKQNLLLTLLSGLVCINTITSAIYHSPRPHEPTPAYVQSIDMPIEYVQESLFIRQIKDHTVYVEQYDMTGMRISSGSGVILDAEKGIVLTADHVVRGAYGIRIITNQGYTVGSRSLRPVPVFGQACGILDGIFDFIFPPKAPQNDQDAPDDEPETPRLPSGPKVKSWASRDLALLTFNQKLGGTSAKFAEIEPDVGDDIYIVGSPYGKSFFNSVSKGILSGKNRTTNRLRGIELYQTDATQCPGNSGGPWFNSNGEIVGIASSWVPNSGNIGLGIPLHELKAFMRR